MTTSEGGLVVGFVLFKVVYRVLQVKVEALNNYSCVAKAISNYN